MSMSNPPSRLGDGSSSRREVPTITLFGDSLTAWGFDTTHGQGLGDVLRERFEGRAEVENEGYPGQTSNTLHNHFHNTILSSFEPTNSPLLITIFLGANDAVSSPQVHVPLGRFITNIRSFVDAILTNPATSATKILLITPPPINVHEAFPDDFDIVELESETDAEREEEFEEAVRKGLGFKTWVSKLRYAEAVVRLSDEYKDREDGRVAVADFWRALANYGLTQGGREKLVDGEVDSRVNGKWPGSGLPGAREFHAGVFTDRLHLGRKGYEVLSAEVLKVLDEKWPDL